jgi:hypothetical protein
MSQVQKEITEKMRSDCMRVVKHMQIKDEALSNNPFHSGWYTRLYICICFEWSYGHTVRVLNHLVRLKYLEERMHPPAHCYSWYQYRLTDVAYIPF